MAGEDAHKMGKGGRKLRRWSESRGEGPGEDYDDEGGDKRGPCWESE